MQEIRHRQLFMWDIDNVFPLKNPIHSHANSMQHVMKCRETSPTDDTHLLTHVEQKAELT